jgi:transposase
MNEHATKTMTARTVGLDAHPDVFTAALLVGTHPANASVSKYWDQRPIDELENWAEKNLRPEDLIVLEASGNSFELCARLARVQRSAVVTDSAQSARLKEAYCSNDKRSAVRIAESWLTGKAKVVWQPDELTLERREVLAAYLKSVKRNTQMRNRIKSFLSDHSVRLRAGQSLLVESSWEWIWSKRSWTSMQRALLESYREDLQQAHTQRVKLRAVIARAVLEDAQLLQLTRLDGIRDLIAFALAAAIGDINRFANPRKLAAYMGVNPSLEQSGNNTHPDTSLKRHGRSQVRGLLIQGAQALLRQHNLPLSRWGFRLLARKSSRNEVVVAVARKMVVAVWYVLKGLWNPLLELSQRAQIKLGKITREVKDLTRQERAQCFEEAKRKLLEQGIYLLDPTKMFAI